MPVDVSQSVNQFLTLSILKGQLEEVYESINSSLVAIAIPTSKRKNASLEELNHTETREVEIKLHITNVSRKGKGRGNQRLVVEELNRLRDFTLALGRTISYMNDQRLDPPPRSMVTERSDEDEENRI